ncbi:MAG TPA: acyl-CoA thioesterase [Oleiagrimonas sp.]|nr:acyl-CoA thioesterase [Oleiagrimonas sp.]
MTERQREVTFRFLAEPGDVNFGGKVHGGMVMKWIDQAGYAAAVGWAGTYCVTVAVEGVQFVRPILIGDLVSVRARLAHTGTSSMHFAVDVSARNLETGDERLATSCVIVFVALDAADGKPTQVPAWEPHDELDQSERDYVLKAAELSRAMQTLVRDRQ